MKLLEMETIEDRERWFRELVMEYDLILKMGELRLLNFLDHWTQEKTYKKGTKKEIKLLLFEIREEESAFDIRKRMAWWKRNNPEKLEGKAHPDQLKLLKDPAEIQKKREELRAAGYVYKETTTDGGLVSSTWIKSN